MTGSLGLILVGAGSSRRMGQVDKVWADLGGHPIVRHSLARLGPAASECVLVVRAAMVERARDICADLLEVRIVAGGDERQESVLLGLEAIRGASFVAVHDVARPFAGESMLAAGLDALAGYDGTIPVVPVTDTVKEIRDGQVMQTLDRTSLRAAQTPQIFRSEALRAAHSLALEQKVSGTDDAQLLELFGFRVGTFAGDPGNFKITTPADLALARLLIESGEQR